MRRTRVAVVAMMLISACSHGPVIASSTSPEPAVPVVVELDAPPREHALNFEPSWIGVPEHSAEQLRPSAVTVTADGTLVVSSEGAIFMLAPQTAAILDGGGVCRVPVHGLRIDGASRVVVACAGGLGLMDAPQLEFHQLAAFGLENRLTSIGPTHVAITDLVGQVELWSRADHARVARLDLGTTVVEDIALSPDGELLAMSLRDASTQLVLHRIATGERVVLDESEYDFFQLAFDADGSELFVMHDNQPRRYDLRTGTAVAISPWVNDLVESVSSLPDGTLLIATWGAPVLLRDDVWVPERLPMPRLRELCPEPGGEPLAGAAELANLDRVCAELGDGQIGQGGYVIGHDFDGRRVCTFSERGIAICWTDTPSEASPSALARVSTYSRFGTMVSASTDDSVVELSSPVALAPGTKGTLRSRETGEQAVVELVGFEGARAQLRGAPPRWSKPGMPIELQLSPGP